MRKNFYKLLALFCALIFTFNGMGVFESKLLADADRTQIASFVERSYNYILDREADSSGLNYWTEKIASGQMNASLLVTNFIESNEFTSRHFPNAEVVNTIYRVMLSREADGSGRDYWTSFLDNGMSPRVVINGFSDSNEFKTLCASYGITAGRVPYVENRDVNINVTSYVVAIYRNAFGNNPDVSGLNYWTGKINRRESYAEDIVSALIFSSDFAGETATDEGFATALYRICFGGTIDAEGLNYWVNFLKRHTRPEMVNQFVKNSNFRNLIVSYGLTPKPTASPTPTPIRGKIVALTFDDGPYSPVTNRILDSLEAVGGRATFFVVGNRVNTYASSVRRAAALGCEIGNHTYDHRATLTSMSASQIRSEIADCNTAVHNLLGYNPVIMRPVGGAFNSTVSSNVGMPMIIWSLDTQDWKNRNTQSVVNAILNNVRDGDIILMHDLYPTTAAAMEIVIPELVRRGYTLVTVSELARARGLNLNNGAAYYSVRP